MTKPRFVLRWTKGESRTYYTGTECYFVRSITAAKLYRTFDEVFNDLVLNAGYMSERLNWHGDRGRYEIAQVEVVERPSIRLTGKRL